MNEWKTILLGAENSWIFLLECALRAGLMFLFVLVLFKLTGKKEVRQFSVLELMVIIGLGSAFGDPMIYIDAPILPSIVAIAVVLLFYWGINKWTNRSPKVEAVVEGAVERVFANGVVDVKALDAEGMSPAEFFGELRTLHVEHLGQVKSAYVEINGTLSVFFHPDDQVQHGLPLAPEILWAPVDQAELASGPASCSKCGLTVMEGLPRICPNCAQDRWVRAVSFLRIT